MKTIIQYLNKLHQFSFIEKLVVLLYSVFSIFLQWLPKNPINAHNLFNNLREQGIKITRKGQSNAFNWTQNNSDLKITLKRNSSDTLVFKQIFLDKEYQPVVDLFLEKRIPLERMIDAGANIGLASLYIKQFFPSANIIALEPNKLTYKRLLQNIETNHLKNLIPLNEGLWSSDTFLTGDVTFRDKKDWSFRLKEAESSKNKGFRAKSVDSLMSEFKWEIIDLLKIDIEGGEDAVFESSETVRKWLPKVRVIALEIHDEFNCRKRIYDFLNQFGFDIALSGGLTIGLNKNLY